MILVASLLKRRILKENFLKTPFCKDCNVILISLDTLSANDLPCYGYERNTAPNLCAFAKQNILFSHAYSNGMYTLPSHVSMFTGLNPNIHGVNLMFLDSLSKQIPFLPEILHQNGYKTIFTLPQYDVTLPIPKVYNRGIDTIYYEKPEGPGWTQALQDFAKNVDKNKKTFLFLHTYTVHTPYLIGNNQKLFTTDIYPNIPLTIEDYNSTSTTFYKKLYQEIQNVMRESSPSIVTEYKKMLSVLVKNNYDPELLDPQFVLRGGKYYAYAWASWLNIKYNNYFNVHNLRDVNYLRALYDQRIHQMDESEITTILKFLSSHERLKKSTIVIFTADHGEEFMEHGSIYHQTIYDSNLHIPLIFYIPGNKKPKQISSPVQLTDLAPTILDMVGISNIYKFQGNSLVEEIEGVKIPDRLLTSDGYGLDTIVLRNKKWKLHASRNSNSTFTPYELYDIQKDPLEKQNKLFSHFNIAEDFLSRYQNYEIGWRKKIK